MDLKKHTDKLDSLSVFVLPFITSFFFDEIINQAITALVEKYTRTHCWHR